MVKINFVIFNIVLCMVGLATSAPINDVQIESYNYKLLPNQNGYNFNFRLSDGQARDEEGSFTPDVNGDEKYVVSGSYQYFGPDNVEYTVYYTADENGFHPYGSHLPGSSGLGISTSYPPPALGIPPNAIASLVG